MEILDIEKINRKEELIQKLLKIWKNSVSVTHLFLSKEEIEKIGN